MTLQDRLFRRFSEEAGQYQFRLWSDDTASANRSMAASNGFTSSQQHLACA